VRAFANVRPCVLCARVRVRAGVGELALKDRVSLSPMEQGATLRQLAADVGLIKLSLSQKADRGEVQVMVDDAIRAREFARGSHGPSVYAQWARPTGAGSGEGHGKAGLAGVSGVPTCPPLLLAQPASIAVAWNENARRATVLLSAPTDPLPPLAPAPPASLIVKWDEDARLATMSLGTPAACTTDQIIDVSEEPEGAEDAAGPASETNMIWM
jgi:hypothetical protein